MTITVHLTQPDRTYHIEMWKFLELAGIELTEAEVEAIIKQALMSQ